MKKYIIIYYIFFYWLKLISFLFIKYYINHMNNSSNQSQSLVVISPRNNYMTGYKLYYKTHREKVVFELGETNATKINIMKQISIMWKELSDDDKEQWHIKAKKLLI